jgi:hypothetical protein
MPHGAFIAQAHYIIKSSRGMSVTIIDTGNDPAQVISVLIFELLPVFIRVSVRRQARGARMRCRIIYNPDITSVFFARDVPAAGRTGNWQWSAATAFAARHRASQQ